MNLFTEMKDAFEGQVDFPKAKLREGTRKWDNAFKKWLASVIEDERHTMRAAAQRLVALGNLPERSLMIPSKDIFKSRHKFDLKLRFTTRYHGDILGIRVYISFSHIHSSWIEPLDKFMNDSISAFFELTKSCGLEPATQTTEDHNGKGFTISNAGYYCLMERCIFIQLADKTKSLDFNDDYRLLEMLGVKHDKN